MGDNQNKYMSSIQSEKNGAISTDLHYLELVSAVEQIKDYKTKSFQKMNLSSGNIVLDLGCGNGDDVVSMSNLIGSKGKVIGLDVNDEAIKSALTKVQPGSNIEFLQHNGEKLPFEDNYFDSIRSDRVFQHLKYPGKVLQEAIRVTKPEGTITIIDPDWDTLVIDSSDFRMTRKIIQTISDAILNPWMGRQIYRLMKEKSLINLDIEPVTITVIKFEDLDFGVNLKPAIEHFVESHCFTKAEMDDWLKDLQDKDRLGHFYSSLALTIVTGTKNAN